MHRGSVGVCICLVAPAHSRLASQQTLVDNLQKSPVFNSFIDRSDHRCFLQAGRLAGRAGSRRQPSRRGKRGSRKMCAFIPFGLGEHSERTVLGRARAGYTSDLAPASLTFAGPSQGRSHSLSIVRTSTIMLHICHDASVMPCECMRVQPPNSHLEQPQTARAMQCCRRFPGTLRRVVCAECT